LSSLATGLFFVIIILSGHTAQISSFRLQYFPCSMWNSKCSCRL
jgi:hypothetical protein